MVHTSDKKILLKEWIGKKYFHLLQEYEISNFGDMNHVYIADINDCTSTSCNGHGVCKDRVNGFDCECFERYNGSQCENGK